jgi:hypothetical protein
MKRSLVFLVCCALGGSGPSLAFATSPGNPLLNIGKGRLTVSAEWEHTNRTLDLTDESDVMSNRYWLKGTYGFCEWLDVTGAVGGVDFDVTTEQAAGSSSFESHHLTFGFSGGLKFRISHNERRNMTILATVNGSHIESEKFVGSSPPSDLIWNEVQSTVAVMKGYGFAYPYVGASYSLVDGELNYERSESFRDPGGLLMAGIDFSLPSRYMLSIEVNSRIGGTWDEISFSVGLSQGTK